jgi:hypothetical protein
MVVSGTLRGAYVGNVAGFIGKLASKFNTVKMCPVRTPYKKSKSRQLLCITKERPAEPHRARSHAQRGASSLHFSSYAFVIYDQTVQILTRLMLRREDHPFFDRDARLNVGQTLIHYQ